MQKIISISFYSRGIAVKTNSSVHILDGFYYKDELPDLNHLIGEEIKSCKINDLCNVVINDTVIPFIEPVLIHGNLDRLTKDRNSDLLLTPFEVLVSSSI